MKSKRLHVIDAARAIAALWVLLFHAVIYLQVPLRGGVLGDGGALIQALPQHVFCNVGNLKHMDSILHQLVNPLLVGHLGVPMFFLVSGFCIHLPAAKALARGILPKVNLKNYLSRRFWRLYPTHVAALIGSIALVSLTHILLLQHNLGPIIPIPAKAVLAHFGMLQAQLPATAGFVFYYNANLWSLETELQLYLAYLVLLKFSVSRGWTKMLFVYLIFDVLYNGLSPLLAQGSFEWTWVLKTFFAGHLYSWCLGAFLAERHCSPSDHARASTIGTLAGYSCLITILALLLPGDLMKMPGIHNMLFVTAFAIALWYALEWERSTQAIIRTPALKTCFDWLVYVGERSYSIYLWQSPVIRAVVITFMALAPALGNHYSTALLASLVGTVSAYLVGIFAFHLVERHFIDNKTGPMIVQDREVQLATK